MSLLVVGIGHPDRGDDAVGPYVARSLGREPLPGVDVLPAPADPSALLLGPEWNQAAEIVLIDAVVTGAEAGTVVVIDGLTGDLGSIELRGTHDLGIGATVALARALRRLPRELVVIGIEGVSFRAGTPMTPAVHVAADRVAGALRVQLRLGHLR